MAVFELFSKRQKRLRGEVPDVYIYDQFPREFRVQLIQIIHVFTGEETHDDYGMETSGLAATKMAVDILRRERGVFILPPSQRGNHDYIQEFSNYILNEKQPELFADALELAGRLCERFGPNLVNQDAATAAINEINQRLREHGLGYEYISGEIVRIDSELVHAEAVKPALTLLHDNRFAGAEQEFLSGFEHYRAGRSKEALTDALKALESTMKVICARRGWTVGGNGTARDLIQACFENGLIPAFWQGHFSGLRSVLESGVPTARNRTSGHGQGETVQNVPDYLASYVLHMTASTIVFLVSANRALH